MTDREIFKDNLRRLFASSGYTQNDLANFVDVDKSTVSGWVHGVSYPRADTMQKISTFFGITLSALVDRPSEIDSEEDQLIRIFRALSSNGKRLMLERAHELLILYGKKSGDLPSEKSV